MVSQSKQSLFAIVISLMLCYDLLKAGTTYLHLVGFNNTFHINHFDETHNMIDFITKFSYINAIIAFINAIALFIAKFFEDKEDQQTGLVNVFKRCLIHQLFAYITFIGLWSIWIKVKYTDQTMVHRAILFGVVYLISRAALLVGDVIGHFIYPGLVFGYVLNFILIIQGLGFDFVDTFIA